MTTSISSAERSSENVLAAGQFIPGLMLGILGAIVAQLGGKYSGPINDVVLAIALGFLIRNFLTLPGISAGLSFDVKYVLRLAIILLGVQFSWDQVMATSGQALWIIFIVVFTTIPVVYFISRKLRLSNKMASLLGVGSAICGATAVLATGPAIEAKEQDMALAIATIFIFNTVALITYPLFGHLWGMPDVVFGTWVGTAVQDISSVVATGFAYTADAGRVATIVKLARTVLIVPVVFLFTFFFSTNRKRTAKGNYARIFPWFVLGFLAVALLNSAGTFSTPVKYFLTKVDHFLVLMVMIGIGYTLSAAEMKKVGFRFLIAGITGMAIMSGVSLLLIAYFIWW
jgi:uncharacterized integral membrane protein (TIGR00698 family)